MVASGPSATERPPAAAGAFYTRIAYHAWRGTPGFSFDDIPDFHDS